MLKVIKKNYVHLLLRISEYEFSKFEISKNNSFIMASFHGVYHLAKQLSGNRFPQSLPEPDV